jgi:hypothetical protein
MAGLAKKPAAKAAAILKKYIGSAKDMLKMLDELKEASKNRGFRKSLRRIAKAVRRSEKKLTKAVNKAKAAA